MLALPKSTTTTAAANSKMAGGGGGGGGREKLELAIQLRNNKKKERSLELLSKSSGDLVLASHGLSNEKLTLAIELEEKMREIQEQQITMLELHDKAFSNTRLTMSKEKLELTRKLEKNMNDLADAQKKLLELHVRSSEDSRLTTALEIQIEEKDIKLNASLKEREKLERELSIIKAEINSLKRTLNLERKDRRQLETDALELIKDAKKKWELSNKDTIISLKQTIEKQTIRITELCTSNNEMSSKLQRLQCDFETTTAELHKLRIYQHEYKESLAKTRELRRQSVAGVENKLEEIATRTHNQLAEIRMKLEMEISKNVELENELRNERDSNHCRISRINVTLELTQSELKERDEELRSLRTMLPALDQEILTLRNQLKERSKQLDTVTTSETIIKNLQNQLDVLQADNKQLKHQLTITKTNLNETISNLKQSENIAFNLEKSILEKTHLEEKLQITEDKDNEKQRKVDGLEEFLNKLQQKLAKLEAENENLQQQKTTSSNSTINNNNNKKSIDGEKKIYEQRIERLEKQLEKNRQDMKIQKEELRKVERNLWKKESEFDKENLHKRIAERKEKSLQEKFDILQKEKNELTEEMKKKQLEIDEKTKKILIQLDTAKQSLIDATKESTRNRLQAESAQHALTQTNKQIEQLQLLNTTLQKEINIIRKDKQSYQDRIALLTSKNKDLTKEITKLNEKKNSLQCKIDDFECKSKELQLNTDVLRETCVVLEEQLTDYERLTSDHETRENTLVQEKMHLQKDYDDIDKKFGELKNEENEEKKKRINAERKIEKLTAEIKEIENKRDTLREQRDEYKKLVKESSNEITNLTMRVSEMECDISQLERALENAKSEAIIVKEESSQYLTRLHEYKDNNQELSMDLESAIEQGQELRMRIIELESVLEEMRQFYQEHEVKAEGTRQQQTKLIDYLQLKLEEQSKKKKPFCEKIFKSKQKQNSTLLSSSSAMQLNCNGMPVGYRELENQLSRERAKVKALTEQLLDLKATIVSSPKKYNNEIFENNNNNKDNTLSLRSSHNIHHKFINELSMRAGKCIACHEPIQFGKRISTCSYCQIMVHCKCLSLVPPNCGLPGGFAKHLALGKDQQWRNSDESISTLSGSVETLTIDEPDNNHHQKNNYINNENLTMESWVKIPGRGKTSWDRKYLRLENNGYLCVYEHEPMINMSPIMKLELNGKSGFSLNETIDQADVPGTAKSDLDFIFRVEEGSHNTCWPSSRLDIMSLNKIDKISWLNALKTVKTSTLCTAKNSIISTILRLEKNRLDLNCVVEIENKENEGILLVCADEGLYSFRPSHSKVLTAIRGVKKVHQLSLYENIGLAIMIAGEDRKLVSCDLRQLKSNAMAADCSRPAITTKNILNGSESCHLYQLQNNLLCAATSKAIILLKWQINDDGCGEFITVKELETTDGSSPCSCAIFTKDNLIVGCQKFFQIDLKNYTVDDFPDDDGNSIKAALVGVARLGIFPVAILNIGHLNNGKIELLLCYNEFGVFVDEHGHRTRAIDPTWNHLPFSFGKFIHYY